MRSTSGDPSQADAALSASQLHALFDILTHYEVYREIRDFRDPSTPANFGFPFVRKSKNGVESHSSTSSAPIIQKIIATFVLPLSGMSALPPTFWSVQAQGLLENFASNNLSESYDKGALGTRKTVATIGSSILEAVSRGQLGGYSSGGNSIRYLNQATYDLDSAASVIKAWDDLVHGLIYGGLIDELFDHAIAVGNLEEHSPVAEAAVQYIIVHLATILHHVFVISPEGQYILKLAENMHKLLPYTIIRQTLRIGNAATMMNAMIKLLLAKLGVGSLSNWIGLTEDADDGMNMLQKIVSMIMSWDSADFKKTADKLKKNMSSKCKEHVAVIEEHLKLPREDQEYVRDMSIETNHSIIVVILANSNHAADGTATVPRLSDQEHKSLLDYYSARLSIRDRDEITRILCRAKPDLATQLLRDLFAAYEPIIRDVHNKVPLHEILADIQDFISEFIEMSKGLGPSGKNENVAPPSVKEYVELLRKHRGKLYKWLHLIAKSCPELREEFRVWCHNSINEFRRRSTSPSSDFGAGEQGEKRRHAAGRMSPVLLAIFNQLDADRKNEVSKLLTRHALYLQALDSQSLRRMQRILDGLTTDKRAPGSSHSNDSSRSNGSAHSSVRSGRGPPTSAAEAGPGIYLVRWQNLLDETLITPATPVGRPRRGRDVNSETTLGKAAATKEKSGTWGLGETLAALRAEHRRETIEAPNVSAVVEWLGPRFRRLLRGESVASRAEVEESWV